MGHTEPHRPVRESRAEQPKDPWVRVATREPTDHRRTAPRMRFDVLQVVAWASGLGVVIAGLVMLARAGFDQLSLFDPVVEVAGLSGTPLLAMLLLLLGVVLLAAATGEVAERELRIGGAVIAVVGAVWLIEPAGFAPWLGVERVNGTAAVAVGVALSAVSFVPPLSIRRPGVAEPRPPWT